MLFNTIADGQLYFKNDKFKFCAVKLVNFFVVRLNIKNKIKTIIKKSKKKSSKYF